MQKAIMQALGLVLATVLFAVLAVVYLAVTPDTLSNGQVIEREVR